MSTRNLGRALHIKEKTVNKKKEFTVVAFEYNGSATRNAKEIKYPELKKPFPLKSEARAHGEKMKPVLEARLPNVRIITRFLYDN